MLAISSSADEKTTIRPARPMKKRARRAFRGMRTFISLLVAVLGTKFNSLMDWTASYARRPAPAYGRLPAPG